MHKIANRILKSIGILLFTTFLISATTLFILSKTVEPNRYRGLIERYLSEATGHPVEVLGSIDFSYFPWPGATISKISIKPCAYIEKFSIKVHIYPLFLGRIKISAARIEGGQLCWIIDRKSKTLAVSRVPTVTKKLALIPVRKLDIRHFDIIRSTLHLIHEKGRQQYHITDINWHSDLHMDFFKQTLTVKNALISMKIQSSHSPRIPLTLHTNLYFSRENQGYLTVSPTHVRLGPASWDQNFFITQLFSSEPQFTIDMVAHHIDLGALLYQLYQQKPVTGTVDFNTHLSTYGNTSQTMLTHAAGSGTLSIQQGTIRGIDLAYLAETGMALIKQQSVPAPSYLPRMTPFSMATASYDIDQGLLTNRDLTIDASPLRGTGQGTLHLLSRIMEYCLTLEAPGGIKVPVDIRGPVTAPSIKVNMQSLAEQHVTSEVKRFIDKNKKGLNKVLQSFFK